MADDTGQSVDALAEVEAIRHGLAACDAGHVRPFAEFTAEMRTKYDLPAHLSDEELVRYPESSAARRVCPAAEVSADMYAKIGAAKRQITC